MLKACTRTVETTNAVKSAERQINRRALAEPIRESAAVNGLARLRWGDWHSCNECSIFEFNLP